MKVRNGFVSNSSSSSFIVAVPDNLSEYENNYLELFRHIFNTLKDDKYHDMNIVGYDFIVEGIEDDIKNLEEQIKTTRKKLKKALNELDDAGKKKDTLDRIKDQIDKLAGEVEAQLERIDDLKDQLEDAKRDLSAAQTANDLATKSQVGYEAFKDREAKLVELEKQRKERDAQQKQVEKINRSILECETNTKSAENALLIIRQSEAEIDRLAPILEEYKKIKNELATAETKVIQRLETENRLEDEDKRLEGLTDERKTVHKKLLSRVEIESVKKDIDEKRTNINQELATLQAQIAQGEEQLSQLKERQALLSMSDTAECPICLSPLKADRIKELEQHYSGEINPLKQKLTLWKKSQKEENGKLSELESQSRDYDRQLERLPSVSRENELIEKIKQQKKVITSWKVKVKAFAGLDEQIKNLRSQKSEFGDIESQYAVHQNAVKDHNKKEKQLEDLHTTLEQYQSQMQEAERALQPYAKLDDITQRVQHEKEDYQADHDQYLSNKQIAQQLEKRAKRANEFQDQLTKTTEASQSKQKTLTTLQESYNQTEHKRVNSDYDRLNKEHGALENRAGMLDQQHQAAINKIQLLLPLEKELSTNVDDLRQLNSSLAVLVFLRKTIREAGPHIVKQLLQAISEEADRIFGEILTDYTARLQWADDYGINIEHQGYVREFSQLSGGEKMAAALAVRLALLHEMSEIRIAFFDEPTANLDDERRDNLAEQMTKITGFDQLFIISHDDTFEHQTDHILRVYKEEGASHIAQGG